MGKETSASTEHGTQTGGEGVGADLPGCGGFGNPVSDGVCIFHGELEPSGNRSKNADVFVSQIYQNLLWEGNE